MRKYWIICWTCLFAEISNWRSHNNQFKYIFCSNFLKLNLAVTGNKIRMLLSSNESEGVNLSSATSVLFLSLAREAALLACPWISSGGWWFLSLSYLLCLSCSTSELSSSSARFIKGMRNSSKKMTYNSLVNLFAKFFLVFAYCIVEISIY